jgi:hypothetical protein
MCPAVENRRWTLGGVTYATLNIQGSCNNLCDVAPEARARHSSAVTLISQADPGFDLTDGARAPLRDPQTLAETDELPDGFHDFLLALRSQVSAFAKPVAYVHGDSHYFRIDKPFLDAQGMRLENFTRVETFGDHQENGVNDVDWSKVLVNADSREVFACLPFEIAQVPVAASRAPRCQLTAVSIFSRTAETAASKLGERKVSEAV